MRGWESLAVHGVDVNILCTVHAATPITPSRSMVFSATS